MADKKPKGRVYGILGIVFSVLSLIVLPIVFGPLAVIFGVIAVLKKDTKFGVAVIILGVVLAVISTLIGMYFLNGSNGDFDTGKYAEENYDRLVTEELSETYGYEVLSVGLLSLNKTPNKGFAYLNMKSLGSRSEQVWNGLMALAGYSDIAGYNLSQYHITILAPTNECVYVIKGESWRAYMDYIQKPQYDLSLASQLQNQINYEINSTKSCS